MPNMDVFLQTLPVMGYGMLGIFIVIGTIALLVGVLCKAFPPEKEQA